MLDHLYTGMYVVDAAPDTSRLDNIDLEKSSNLHDLLGRHGDDDSDAGGADTTFSRNRLRAPDRDWTEIEKMWNSIKRDWNTHSQKAVEDRSKHALSVHMKLYTLAHKLGMQKLTDATVDNIVEESKQAALRNQSFPPIARRLLCGEPFRRNERLTHRLVRVCLDEVGFMLSEYENDLVKLLHEKAPTACHYFRKHSDLEQELKEARVTKGWVVGPAETQEVPRRNRAGLRYMY